MNPFYIDECDKCGRSGLTIYANNDYEETTNWLLVLFDSSSSYCPVCYNRIIPSKKRRMLGNEIVIWNEEFE